MSDLDRFRLTLPGSPGLKQLASDSGPSARVEPASIGVLKARYKKRPARYLLLFDATGSMSSYWNAVLKSIDDIIGRLLSLQGSATMKIVAYRDDCDGPNIIETSHWSQSATELRTFIRGIQCTGGGDAPEAIDRALQTALDEQDLSRCILIGDVPPHEERDCKKEATGLGQMKRPVYPILVGNDPDARRAFETIARLSGGKLLELTNLEELFELITIVAVHDMGEQKLREYAKRYPPVTAGARLLLKSLSDK